MATPYDRFRRFDKPLSPIGPNYPLPPPPVLTAQQKATKFCPRGCKPQMTFDFQPGPMSPDKMAHAFCLVCASFWTVDEKGEVVRMLGFAERVELDPKTFQPKPKA